MFRAGGHGASAFSVGPRQTQDVLPEEGQDHVVVDRRDLIDASLAEFAFHVVFVDEAITAVGIKADVGGLPAGLGGDELGGIGFRAALLAGVEQLGGAVGSWFS
jgi:hypothetical protein